MIADLALDNKYARWYTGIVTNALTRSVPVGYIEKHHILPRSFELGGVRDKRNIVPLTAREHFVCHWLLTKMFKSDSHYCHKMIYALVWLSTGTKKNKHLKYHTKITSRVIERNRIQVAAIRGIECTINGQRYPNPWQAHLILGIEYCTILRRLKSPRFPEYQADKVEKREVKRPRYYKRVSIDGIVYETYKDAAKQTGIPNLFNKLRDERFPSYFFVDDPIKKIIASRDWNYAVTANGNTYTSVAEATKQLGLTRSELEARLKDPNNHEFISENIEQSTKPRLTREQQKRKIMVNGVKFDSITDAIKTLGVHKDTLKYRLKSEKFKDIYYITKGS